MAVLDSGCTKNVCGETWLNCYLETLNEDEVKYVTTIASNASFKFGSGEAIQSIKRVSLPSVLAGKKVLIETDVVKCDIPLLLSKEAMQKASMQIFFKNDTVIIFGERNKLLLTSTGHYCVPISKQPDNSQIR